MSCEIRLFITQWCKIMKLDNYPFEFMGIQTGEGF